MGWEELLKHEFFAGDDEFIKLEHLELPAQPLMEEYARKIMQKQRADRERDDRRGDNATRRRLALQIARAV